MVLEKTLESPLDCKEVEPVNPKGNQSWIFIGRVDPLANPFAKALILSPPDAKNWLIKKDPGGKDWRQEEKGTTEGKIIGWHHIFNGHESEQALGDGEGQGSLTCCSPWGCEESDMTEWLNNTNNYTFGAASCSSPLCIFLMTYLPFSHCQALKNLYILDMSSLSVISLQASLVFSLMMMGKMSYLWVLNFNVVLLIHLFLYVKIHFMYYLRNLSLLPDLEDILLYYLLRSSQVALVVKYLTANAGRCKRSGFSPWVGKIPWKGHDSPLQYSCLENSMDRGAWRATVQRVTQSWTRLKWLSTWSIENTVVLVFMYICL